MSVGSLLRPVSLAAAVFTTAAALAQSMASPVSAGAGRIMNADLNIEMKPFMKPGFMASAMASGAARAPSGGRPAGPFARAAVVDDPIQIAADGRFWRRFPLRQNYVWLVELRPP
jgi:hypothetical protein